MAGFNREKYLDSYYHYRNVMKMGRVHAGWRTFAYEFLKWPDGKCQYSRYWSTQ